MTVLLLTAAIAWSCGNAQSQKETNVENPDSVAPTDTEEEELWGDGDHCDDEDPEIIPVQFVGEQPTIVDFARAYIASDDRGENYVLLADALSRYEKGQKPAKGELTVDKANGYLSFNGQWRDLHGDLRNGTNEMCFWNCKDGRKLFAVNVKCIMGTHYDWYYEPLFYFYDKESRSMEFTIMPDINAFIEATDLAWPQRSIQGDELTHHWPIYTLPHYGKSMKVSIADTTIPDSKHRTCELIWNGSGFDKKFDK